MKRESTKGEAIGLALIGLEVHEVRITAHVAPCGADAASLTIAGLEEPATRETRVRIRSSLSFDNHRVAVNVEGVPRGASTSQLDLAIAAAVLRALPSASPVAAFDDTAFVGELGFDGRVKAVRGAAVMAEKCRRPLVLPAGNEWEASLSARVADPRARKVRLAKCMVDLMSNESLEKVAARDPVSLPAPHDMDRLSPSHESTLEKVRAAKRVLLIGPPGAGKTMIARRVGQGRSLSSAAFREVLGVYNVAGLSGTGMGIGLPFRAPHHTVSEAGLVGGGDRPRPGEVSLAHRGVLFLDELLDFRLSAIQTLGGVLRAGAVRSASFPAAPEFVIAAVNPCPCGRGESAPLRCTCSPAALRTYGERIDRYCALLGITERITLSRLRLEDLAVTT